MSLLTLTTVLSYMALAACAAALFAQVMVLVLSPGKAGALPGLAVSAATAAVLIRGLVRLSSGLMCYRPLSHTLLLYGGILLLQLYFLADAARTWKALAGEKEVCPHDR